MTYERNAGGSELAPRRAQLMQRLLAAEGLSPGDTILPRPDREAPAPLALAQERLWFIEHLFDTRGAYIIPILLRFEGPLDVAGLRAAFASLVARHEALRTAIEPNDGRPQQRVVPPFAPSLPVVDLTAHPEPHVVLRRLTAGAAGEPFDLTKAPLWRAVLYRLGPAEHWLLLTLHHLIADGGSLAVLLDDLASTYRAAVAGEAPALPPLPVQYADYAVWQRSHLAGPVTDRLLDYWRSRLAGAPPALQLPTDWPRPPLPSFAGARETVHVPKALTERLKALGQRHNATLFMVLLAAFQALLARYGGQDDIVVGTPIANRTRAEVQRAVGFFVNTLLIRADLADDPPFQTFLARVREAALGAYAHQDLPLALLIADLQPTRTLDRQPMFQAMFVLQNTPIAPIALPRVEVTVEPIHNGSAKFDLLLDVAEGDDGLEGYLEYRTDLFGAETIAGLVGHYRQLLESIVEHPGQPVGVLSLAAHADAEATAASHWRPAPGEADTLHERVAQRAARTPDAVALVYEGRALTYQGLDRRANRLANYLRSLGVASERRVGLCLERSIDMVVAALAIMKAGGAYVPLDPGYPAPRIATMLETAGVSIIVTDTAREGILPAHAAKVVRLDTEWAYLAGASAADPRPPVRADGVAYVVFTSGSTGRPKGILAHHAGALNHVDYTRARFGIGPGETVLQCASLVSDASVEDLLGALIAGARVVLVSSAQAREPLALVDRIVREQVTAILATTPSFLARLGEAGRIRGRVARTLRLVFCNGEPLRFAECVAMRRAFGDQCVVVNQYGPTEAGVTATEYRVHAATPAVGPVPLGEVNGGMTFHLLNQDLERVPGGAAGELYIGGVGLARGYQGMPGQTAAAFVPDPFAGWPGARLYKTGDRLRRLAGGQLEFVGRIDEQVKIRGYRIEPSEVEAALTTHPQVTAAVVAAREDGAGERVLVAYLETPGPGLRMDGLRHYLRRLVPDYMIPSAVVTLERMPRLPNGKVDRAALPAPPRERPDLMVAFEPPVGLREQRLAEVFGQVLARERVGRHDDFFALGGHSLAAMRVVAALSHKLGQDVPVRLVFLHPTVATLAQAMDAGVDAETATRTSPRAHPSRPEPAPGVSVHRRPLAEAIAAGDIAPVDAVALGYLPEAVAGMPGASPADVAEAWFGRRPALVAITETALGRLGSIWLPTWSQAIYRDQPALVAQCRDALQLAGDVGARIVSLTGLLPSATDYGRAVAAVSARPDLPALTTGHATTAATVVLTLERMARVARRRLGDEVLGVLGLGSIGVASLALLLDRGPWPRGLVLCDVPGRRAEAEALADRLARHLGYDRPIEILAAGAHAPEAFYRASVVIGATNVPRVLDVARLNPGTLLIDDSAPHCFDVDAAFGRAESAEDILFTAAGTLELPRPMAQARYLPASLEPCLAAAGVPVGAFEPRWLGGCALSPLLSLGDPALDLTIGVATPAACRRHYERLRALELDAAPAHCEGRRLDATLIEGFAERYGTRED